MKNIQVIDGPENCTYDIFSISDRDFKKIFPNRQDIEFIEDFTRRIGKSEAGKILCQIWKNPVDKKKVNGLHGTQFYELEFKKVFYPTKRDDEMVTGFENKITKL